MKEIIKKIDAAVRVLNNIEVKQKQNLLNMGGVIDLLESVIVDLPVSYTHLRYHCCN